MQTCTKCAHAFEYSSQETAFYDRIKVPAPTWCPPCRAKRRMLWRNERNLYRNTCGICKRSIISIYATDTPFTVLCNECFHGDAWDPMDYGMDIDFSKPFLEQWRELQLRVPRLYAFVFQNSNSEYVNGAAFNKNCYLLFVSDYNEDSSYSYSIANCRYTYDSMTSNDCELCYEVTSCTKCYRVTFSEDCSNSQDLAFCKNCTNSHDCIGSVNLRNKQYCIYNEQYTKEEYLIKKAELALDTREGIERVAKQAHELWSQGITKYMHGIQNIDVTGDYASNSKNAVSVFDSELLEDSAYINHGNKSQSVHDGYVVVDGTENSYEIVSAIALNNVVASYCTWHGFDIAYADTCENSNNLFGCIGLKKKQYCILNKQYTKEQYTELVQKLKQHISDMPYRDESGISYAYGEFFPQAFSPFAYNETATQEYFPLEKTSAAEQGYRWREPEKREYTIEIQPDTLPSTITETDESIVGKVIACAHATNCNHSCTTAFRITPAEFQIYQRLGIPVPHLCPNCRHGERFAKRNPLRLWKRTCVCANQNHGHPETCTTQFETTYAPESNALVYCEACYKQEVL